jgi:S-adenosylmethionine:tRNA ribosyltransferase-isomerase
VGPEAFDYALPEALVAQRPAARRGDARMLVVDDDGARTDTVARTLPEHVPEGALVVVNDSRVVPARVVAVRETDDRTFELLVVAPAPGLGPGATIDAWVRGGKKLKDGDRVRVGALVLEAEGSSGGGRGRRFRVVEGDVLATLHAEGATPLPPYIARPHGPEPDDVARYQTIYAGPEGSVAAPTAGLHLEPDVLEALDVVRVQLHVGPGTFLPMDVADVHDHRIDPERIVVDAHAAARISTARETGRPVLAIGTTVVRALESIAHRNDGAIVPTDTSTDLVIKPGHAFAVVTHLLTNFHLPRSSLLMLVCSFAGRERVLAAYEHAVTHGYRFYSYGDCMFVGRSR